MSSDRDPVDFSIDAEIGETYERPFLEEVARPVYLDSRIGMQRRANKAKSDHRVGLTEQLP